MKQTELLLLHSLTETLHPDSPSSKAPFDLSVWQQAVPELLTLARQQKILPPVYEFLCRHDIEIPEEMMPSLTTELSTYVLSCQQMKFFTEYTCKILDRENIPYALLKGCILSELYPKPEYRRYGDVDILINEPEAFQKAVTLLSKSGFRQIESCSNHHYEFELIKHGHTYILELHRAVTNINDNVALYDTINALYDSISLTCPLSATYEALYLLLHTLKHLLSFGFGIKLLCDWVVYLEAHTNDISDTEFQTLLNQLGLVRFAWSITAFCRQYLGLKQFPECLSYELTSGKKKEIFETLAEDIFSGGEYGYADTSRTLIMKDNSSLIGYCRELHRQTRRNYPTGSNFFPFLPFLWLATGIRFLYNNHHIRHVSTRSVITTEKKRQKLRKLLKINL